MCTFFVKSPKQSINKEHFTTIIENNPQGFGFVYTTGTKLVIVKSASPNAESLWKKFCDAESKYPKSNFIGHGRIATGSNINSDNTHPFFVSKSLAMVHNGILRQFPSTIQKSDTVQYIEQVLRKLPKNFLSNKAILDMISRDITGSKFAFLSVDNKVYVINRHQCVTDAQTGVLFSNRNYIATDWLDYGGTKIAKSTIYGTATKKTEFKPNLSVVKKDMFDFHIDADAGEIVEDKTTQSNWRYCGDCHDYVKDYEFNKDWMLCNDCMDDYGIAKETKHIDGKDENLPYCDDCGYNVASVHHDGWKLCDCCVHSYKDSGNKDLLF
jgi:predicted glutamine amidotransferase